MVDALKNKEKETRDEAVGANATKPLNESYSDTYNRFSNSFFATNFKLNASMKI